MATRFVPLGPADIPDGETRDYQAGEYSILVANCGGALHAIEDRCTHDDGPLADGKLIGCEVECPRHGAKFDMHTGRPTALPAFRPVASYPVRVVDDVIEVEIED
ncbi:MAG TPA: non-heme iron oxygenase ferredoxin subunit [Tepidiformaceae bacterium]|nr:non-heme iron oxygenase ferredoxin subunit [Tepidiformaceae bacterium]